jgi:uncharacterized protein (TIGR02145 family)
MKRTILLLTTALLAFSFSCKKAPEAPKGSSKVSAGNTTIENIKATSVKANSSCNAGFSELQDHGFCWGTNANPDLSGSYKSLGSKASYGDFSADITSLTENTHYFIRSFVKSQNQVRYGEQNEYTTVSLTLPVVSTASVTDITATTATSGGNVTSDGNGTVSARGVCWNTAGNPTLANSIGHTTDGTGAGSFTSSITGLNNGTTYYVTAYATNEKGTAYSTDVKQFVTLVPFLCGNTVPHGGKNYQTVQIGTQCWFKENLNIGARINGSQNQTNNGIIEKYCYDDNESNCNVYGGLYQWDELMQYVTTQGAKGLCPDGWHIPTDAEWTTLTNYLGGEAVAGGKMKEAGYTHWAPPNTGATNSSGFTALPGGLRGNDGSFYNLSYLAYFWSSSQNDATYAWHRYLYYSNESVYRNYFNKAHGFSCRCLQD